MLKHKIVLTLILTSVVVVSGLTLTACQTQSTPVPATSPINLDQTSVTTPTNQPTSVVNNQKVPTMKTLTDLTPISGNMVKVTTSKGEFTIQLDRDKAPLTSLNFLNLVQAKFYDGIVFHRVIPGFMAQVGDPLTKDVSQKAVWGTGGPGYTIADEFDPSLKHDKKGVVSMANAGPNTGGSQIFITYAPQPHLDGVHAVFGQVVSGMEIVDMITVGDKIISAQIVK